MLAKYSITTKVLVMVTFLLAVIAGLGALAYVEMRAINAAAQDIETQWLPSVRWIGEMRVQSARYRAVLRDHLLVTDPAQRPDIDKNLAARKADYEKAAKKYEPLISSPAERELANDIQKLWADFISAAETVQIAASKGDLATAKELNANQVVKTGRAMDAVLAKLVVLNDAGAEAAGHTASDVNTQGTHMMLGIFAFALLLGAFAAITLVRDIRKGIESILKPMGELAGGDVSVQIPQHAGTTEIGRIASSLEVFKQALIAKKASDACIGAEAQNKAARADRISTITRDFETMMSEMVNTMAASSTELEASATTLTKTSETTMTLSTSAASASQAMSENIQSVAAATEEITSSVHEIGRQVTESTRIAATAVSQAQKSDQSIAKLSEATGRIDNVVKLITAVAEQTNLLALNATIEAARAGEAGRGFAVVASEVKALAAQTARATHDISAEIAGMQAASAETVSTIRAISSTITLISEVSTAIAAAVEEQGAATQEIARNVQRSTDLSNQVAADVAVVNEGSGETSSASGQVLDAAKSLSMQSEHLRRQVGAFLDDMRAA